jgi:hypothetical protein
MKHGEPCKKNANNNDNVSSYMTIITLNDIFIKSYVAL